MKKCPICFEDIQDDAIKCRYCNEWLDGRKSSSTIFTKTKDAIKHQIEDYQSRTTGYLDLPTSEKPLFIDKITLFPDRVRWTNQSYYLNDLQNIFFYSKTYGANSEASSSISFSLFFKSNDGVIKKRIFQDDESDSILGKKISNKIREQINLMYKFVSKTTLKNRLAIYLNELSTNGFLNYVNGIKIYINGDIYQHDEYRANLIEAKNSGRVEIGSKVEPYNICIYKDTGNFATSLIRSHSIFENKEEIIINFSTYLDNDVMSLFFFELFLNKKTLDPEILTRIYLK